MNAAQATGVVIVIDVIRAFTEIFLLYLLQIDCILQYSVSSKIGKRSGTLTCNLFHSVSRSLFP